MMYKRIVQKSIERVKKLKDLFFEILQSRKTSPQPRKPLYQRTSVSSPLSDDQVNKLLTKLDREISKYEKDLLAYKVRIETNRQRAPLEVEEKLTDKYGEVLGKPVLELSKIFVAKKDWQISSEVEKQWLSKKNITYIEGRPPGFQIEEVLDENTDKKALQIIKKAFTDQSKEKNKVSRGNTHPHEE